MRFRRHCCAASAQKRWQVTLKPPVTAAPRLRRTGGTRAQTAARSLLLPRGLSSDRFGGRVMRLQGWVSLCGFLCSSSRRQAAVVCSFKHVCLCSQAGSTMAEEAKKLAAYAAVDNHVQVPRSGLPFQHVPARSQHLSQMSVNLDVVFNLTLAELADVESMIKSCSFSLLNNNCYLIFCSVKDRSAQFGRN